MLLKVILTVRLTTLRSHTAVHPRSEISVHIVVTWNLETDVKYLVAGQQNIIGYFHFRSCVFSTPPPEEASAMQHSDCWFQGPFDGAGRSELDMDRVNMFKHAGIARVPWTWSTLRAGDCIYIPAGKYNHSLILPAHLYNITCIVYKLADYRPTLAFLRHNRKTVQRNQWRTEGGGLWGFNPNPPHWPYQFFSILRCKAYLQPN